MPVYVVQVVGGEEQNVCKLIHKIVSPEIISECFVPCSEIARKSAGVWSRVERPMFPGYVFVETNDPEALETTLAQVPRLTRVLRSGGRCIPLTSDEVAWINAVGGKDSRTFAMSTGIIEGGKIIILNGPLEGRTTLIKKIDRHKRMAYVEVEMFGRTNLVRMGLEVIKKTA